MLNKFKQSFHIKYVVALVIIIVTAIVIWSTWHKITNPITPIDDANTVYKEAVSRLLTSDNIHYKVTGIQKTTNQTTSTEESYTQLVTYESLSTENFKACVEENLTIGSQSIISKETYANGTVLFTVNGINFQSQMSADTYKARYAPAAPINSTLYAEISGTKQGGISTITFNKPHTIEQWVTSDHCTNVIATAAATIDKNGNLLYSNYDVTFQTNETTITLNIIVEILQEEYVPIRLPNYENYITVPNASIPKLVEKACNYLLALTKISATYSDTIICDAFGDVRTQTTALTTNRSEDYTAEIDTTIALSNSSKAGSEIITTRNDRFYKGVYSYSTDGIHYEIKENILQTDMEQACNDMLVSTILRLDYITSFEILDHGSTLEILFTPTEEFAKILAQDACQILYNDPTILSEQTNSCQVSELSSYLHIDKNTGYPIKSGFHYSESFDIGGIQYQLSFVADQQYN